MSSGQQQQPPAPAAAAAADDWEQAADSDAQAVAGLGQQTSRISISTQPAFRPQASSFVPGGSQPFYPQQQYYAQGGYQQQPHSPYPQYGGEQAQYGGYQQQHQGGYGAQYGVPQYQRQPQQQQSQQPQQGIYQPQILQRGGPTLSAPKGMSARDL
jgi:hypothetical protein